MAVNQYQDLGSSKLVDPFKVAALENGFDSIGIPLPGPNFMTRNIESGDTVTRYWINRALALEIPGSGSSLLDTLYLLASLRRGVMGTGNPDVIRVKGCATCDYGPIDIRRGAETERCVRCGADIYPSDVLQLWLGDDESQGIQALATRVMNVFERLQMVHSILAAAKADPASLATTAIIMDGPLAVITPWNCCNWLHAPIMQTLADITRSQLKQGYAPPLVMGFQKTGLLVDFANSLNQYLPSNTIMPIDDSYRYKFVLLDSSVRAGKKGFGSETYFGQDFIYKSPTGRVYVFGLPYPFESKFITENFVAEKIELDRYRQMNSALAFVNYFAGDRFYNSIVPVELAHRFTSLSSLTAGKMWSRVSLEALDAAQQEQSIVGAVS